MKTASRIKLAATFASVVRASTRPGAPSLSERAHAVPRLVRATLDHSYSGTTVRRLGLVAAALAYVVSPIDLMPEALLPVLGAADDAVVLTWAVKVFLEETDRFIGWELGRGARAGARSGPAARSSASAPWAAPSPATSGTASSVPDDRTGAAASERIRLPEGTRQAATDYVMESVRKRLER